MIACIPDTTSPGKGRNRNRTWLCVTGISPLRGSLRAAPIACDCGWAGVPTLMLSSQDRSAMACFLDGWIRSLPYCRFDAVACTGRSWRKPPMSLPILCLYKAHQRMYFCFWIFCFQATQEDKSPYYLSEFGQTLKTKNQKLPKKSKKVFIFDSIFLRLLFTPVWLIPFLLA